MTAFLGDAKGTASRRLRFCSRQERPIDVVHVQSSIFPFQRLALLVALSSPTTLHQSVSAFLPRFARCTSSKSELSLGNARPTPEMSSSSTSRDPLAGHLNHLTSSQEQAFTSLKALLKSRDLYTDEPTPSHDDSTILRFLRARRFDIQGAYKQFSEAEQWRKNTEVEKLYEGYDITEYDEARKVFPMWTGRQDRTGHPFYVFRVKDLDKKVGSTHVLTSPADPRHHFRKLRWSQAMDRYNHSSPTAKNSTTDTKRPPPVVALYEHLTRLVAPLVSKRPNRPNPETPIVSSANIVDVTGVSLMQFLSLRSHLGESSGLATARYPETLNSIYVRRR